MTERFVSKDYLQAVTIDLYYQSFIKGKLLIHWHCIVELLLLFNYDAINVISNDDITLLYIHLEFQCYLFTLLL